MLRPVLYALAAVILAAHTGTTSCDDHHHDDVYFINQDVTVEITGDSGTAFDAFFEDDDQSQTASATVPYSAVFENQRHFFRAIVDKKSGGAEQICVHLTTPHRAKSDCTDAAFGRVSISIIF